MYTVFQHSADLSYKAPICSKVTVFYAVTTILTFVPPLLIAFRSQGTVHNYFKVFNEPRWFQKYFTILTSQEAYSVQNLLQT